jgi:hypothetical protein
MNTAFEGCFTKTYMYPLWGEKYSFLASAKFLDLGPFNMHYHVLKGIVS